MPTLSRPRFLSRKYEDDGSSGGLTEAKLQDCEKRQLAAWHVKIRDSVARLNDCQVLDATWFQVEQQVAFLGRQLQRECNEGLDASRRSNSLDGDLDTKTLASSSNLSSDDSVEQTSPFSLIGQQDNLWNNNAHGVVPALVPNLGGNSKIALLQRLWSSAALVTVEHLRNSSGVDPDLVRHCSALGLSASHGLLSLDQFIANCGSLICAALIRSEVVPVIDLRLTLSGVGEILERVGELATEHPDVGCSMRRRHCSSFFEGTTGTHSPRYSDCTDAIGSCFHILGLLGWHVALGRLDGDDLCKCAIGPPRHHVVSALVKYIWDFAAGLNESERTGAALFLSAIFGSESWCEETEERVLGAEQVVQVRQIMAKLLKGPNGPLASLTQNDGLRKTQSTYEVNRAAVQSDLRAPDFGSLRMQTRWLRSLKQYANECARDRYIGETEGSGSVGLEEKMGGVALT